MTGARGTENRAGATNSERASRARRRAARTRGFTLIELMIVVAMLGILAALAIPSFIGYVRRSKSAEATNIIGALFKGDAAYYSIDWGKQGLGGGNALHCTIEHGWAGVWPPRPEKVAPQANEPMKLAGFPGPFVYYNYNNYPTTGPGNDGTSVCGNAKETASLYLIQARGDLDGDCPDNPNLPNTDPCLSHFRLDVGTDANNEVYHARGIFFERELE